VVSRKTAAEVGWFHPHLLTFIVLASPLARERSSWSFVAEPRPDDVTPKKPQSFDVSTVKDAALKTKEGNGSTPTNKDARGAAAAAAASAAAAAEKAASAAEKAASVVEAFTTLKQKRELRDALKEAIEEESDEEEKGELKARYKKAKRAYLDACDPEVK
jgi:hypothetical protein